VNKVQRVSSLRAAVQAARKDKKTIGFVPTMGNLHEGHLELVRLAKRRAEFVVVSIYVNPTQFGKNEDLANYPSTPEEDARSLAEIGADLLFLPEQETMYPGDIDEQTVVYVPNIGDMYCGKDRPEHFYGVTTVVSIAIIRRMVEDLAYPIQIVGVDTVRSEEGLALSSRNGYLTEKQLAVAPSLQQSLRAMSDALKLKPAVVSKKALKELEDDTKSQLKKLGFKPQYITVCRQRDLKPAKKGDTKLVILAAAQIGKARLIDNIEVELGEPS